MSDRLPTFTGPDFRDPAQRPAAVAGLTHRRAERGLPVSRSPQKRKEPQR